MRLPYNSHTGQAFAKLKILKVPHVTLMDVGEFMHRCTYNPLPDAFIIIITSIEFPSFTYIIQEIPLTI